MKSILFLFLACFYSVFIINAQSVVPANNNNSTYIHCTKFYISKQMKDLPDYKFTSSESVEAADEMRRMAHRSNNTFRPGNDYTDPIRQTKFGLRVDSITPKINFNGINSGNCPNDPNGAVSADYYVQAVNILYTVFDKNGNTILPPKDLGSLWSGDPQDGDPIVLYDKFADRWFLSEFQRNQSPKQVLVAVSTTNDPTGSYYVWEFNTGVTPDYPKYSIWTDGYYLTFQGFNNGNPYVQQKVAVLERNRMLNGDPSAGIIFANLPSPPLLLGGNNDFVSAPKTLDCDASALPPYGSPNYLVYFENTASGQYSNSIVMYKLTTDTGAHTLTVSRADSFAVPYFNGYFSDGSEQDISEPGYPHEVDALDGTFNFRVPYMEFTGYNSVVLSNTVNTGNSVAGIRWYELRQNPNTQVWSIYQEGTYAPSDGISRWNGSICMDNDGNIALQYCVSSSSVYPGIRYTGRLAGDALGQMTFAEKTVINGTTSIACNNRWGDYSQLDIDPSDGITFWGVNEYGGQNGTYKQQSRIFSFSFAGTTGINEVQNQTQVKVYQNGNFLQVKATGLSDNENLQVDLFDISGRQLTTQTVAPAYNKFETKINVSSLPKGVYFLRIGRQNFQKVIKTIIN